MSGRFSQKKGKREELMLCHALREFGYTDVCRIPHWQQGKHNADVQGSCPKTGLRTTFENKTRKKLPIWISRIQGSQSYYHRVVRMDFGGHLVAMGVSPLEVQEDKDIIFEGITDNKLFKKFQTLYKLVDGADFLVMRGSRGYRVYFKFWRGWGTTPVKQGD